MYVLDILMEGRFNNTSTAVSSSLVWEFAQNSEMKTHCLRRSCGTKLQRLWWGNMTTANLHSKPKTDVTTVKSCPGPHCLFGHLFGYPWTFLNSDEKLRNHNYGSLEILLLRAPPELQKKSINITATQL